MIVCSLKPENVLIDADGYAKLTDFGLSKNNINEDNLARSFCGTPEYVAPEVIQRMSYGMSCDWWSLGCVIYEMLTTLPPFYSLKKSDLYEATLNKEPKFFKFHSMDAIDLIQKLLLKDPSHRLCSKQGASEIKKHPFFSDIDWQLMEKKLVKAPYKPLLDDITDTKHFAPDITNTPLESPNSFR